MVETICRLTKQIQYQVLQLFMRNRDFRIEKINEVLLAIAEGDFAAQADISDQFDDIDAIASGVNMLSEELRDSVITRNYLNSVLLGVVDMLIIFDENFVIKEVNSKLCQMLGKPEEFFLHQPIAILFDKRKADFIQTLKDAVAKRAEAYNVETEFKVKRQPPLPVALSLSALKERDKITGYLLIAKDLKQILLTSQALEQKNKELKTLLYKVSHDFKGPLASVLGLFQIVEHNDHDLDTLQYYMTLIKKSVVKLNSTVEGLLSLGEVDDSRGQFTTFNVHDAVQQVVQTMKDQPGIEDIAVEIAVSPELKITSEASFFHSILQNLIENSIKYRRTSIYDSYIKITARENGRGIYLWVKDNGQGMNKHVQQRAFDMFYRGNLASSGSGLGLFVVKSNVEKLGGEVKLKSKLQEGTEVKLLLPSINQFEFK